MFGGIATRLVTLARKTPLVAAVWQLWSWGRNVEGQLGLRGVNAGIDQVAQVGADTKWAKLAKLSRNSSGGIKEDGTFWAWGYNATVGSLGTGDGTSRSSPVQIGSATNWGKVAFGWNHTLAIRDGKLWTWGSNANGQLGSGNVTTRSSPVQVGTNNWGDIAASQYVSLAVGSDGTLWSWGRNTSGVLGLGDVVDRSSPVQIGTDTNWSKVSSGRYSSAAIKTTGTLWVWGQNNYGQLGQGNGIVRSSPVQVGADTDWDDVKLSANGQHMVARKTNGTLWSWGRNNYGQLGLNNATNRSSPVQIGSGTTWSTAFSCANNAVLALTTSGNLWAWGQNTLTRGILARASIQAANCSPVQIFTDASNWSAISHCTHVTAQKTTGALFSWGINSQGRLGIGSVVGFASASSPCAIGSDTNWSSFSNGQAHVMAIRTTGSLWAWGSNSNGKLGKGTTLSVYSSPVQVGTDTNWSNTMAGRQTSVAVKTTGSLWAWGLNSSGQLGDGTVVAKSSPIQVGSDTSWSKAFTFNYTSFGTKTDGTLWGWGDAASGRLGDGTVTNKSSPVQIGSATDWSNLVFGPTAKCYHVAVVKSNGTLWTWGINTAGKLGLSDTTNRSVPVQVGSGTDWAYVSAGPNVTLAIKTNGTLWGWGRNQYGELLTTNGIAYSSPIQINADTNWSKVKVGYGNSVIALRTTGTLWTWGGRYVGAEGTPLTASISSPVQIGSLSSWLNVSAGSYHTIATKSS